MTKRFEQCLSIGRKKVLFGIALAYVVAFLVLQYRYGWSFASFITTFGQRGQVAMAIHPDNLLIQDLELKQSDNSSESTGLKLQHRPLDIHFEDPNLGHTGEASGHADHGFDITKDMRNHIAIGGGITSKKLTDVTKDNIKSKFQFFSILLPSFCRTVATGYHYHFYLAYDSSDPIFSNRELLAAFSESFDAACRSLCPKSLNVSLHFVQCSHQGRPAWAQNDAMMEAYLDGMEYFYRVNDDSILESSGWVEAFTSTLASYDPPNVGVVGPKHIGGNELILTYDFVHRTHLEVFGFYYPRVFTDWYADDWVTKVYIPGRMKKLAHIHLKHTMTLGQRYRNDFSIYPKLESQLRVDKITLSRYISYRNQAHVQTSITKVIAMTIYGNNPRYTMGAIRNAQLLPLFFPGWSMRVYVAKPSPEASDKKYLVPERIIARLKSLGVQIVFVDLTNFKLEPKWWSFLVVDDPSIEYFLVRNSDSRLSDRDAAAVKDFLEASDQHPDVAFHCIRDHQNHAATAVVNGLWGGKGTLRDRLKPGIHVLLQDFVSNHSVADPAKPTELHPSDFLSTAIWPLVRDIAYCHDSVSCKNWNSTYSFPAEIDDTLKFVGQRYNTHQEIDGGSASTVAPDCNGKGKWKPVLTFGKTSTPIPASLSPQIQRNSTTNITAQPTVPS